MNYINRKDRCIKAASMMKVITDNGGAIKEIAEYSKWRNLNEGSRIQVTFTIVRMENAGNVGYILKDSLGMLACYPTTDLQELKSFLIEKGFKPIKDWYLQDCGMTEDTWNEWNKSND